MAQAAAQVIIPRRNFLVRALGFTAAGATLTLPIVTVDDAKARIAHHTKELHRALADAYPNLKFMVRHELPDPAAIPEGFSEIVGPLVILISEKPAEPHPHPVYSDWRAYDAARAARAARAAAGAA